MRISNILINLVHSILKESFELVGILNH